MRKEETYTGIALQQNKRNPSTLLIDNSPHCWSQFPNKALTSRRQKQDPSFYCFQETYHNIKGRPHIMVKEWKKIFQTNWSEKQAGVAILISNKYDLKPKLKKRNGRTYTYLSKKNSTKNTLQLLTSTHQIKGHSCS